MPAVADDDVIVFWCSVTLMRVGASLIGIVYFVGLVSEVNCQSCKFQAARLLEATVNVSTESPYNASLNDYDEYTLLKITHASLDTTLGYIPDVLYKGTY